MIYCKIEINFASRSLWTEHIWRDGLVHHAQNISALQKTLFRAKIIILARKIIFGLESNYCKRRSAWWSCNRLGIWWSAAACDGVGSSPAIKFACLRCINLEVQLRRVLHVGRDRPWFTCSAHNAQRGPYLAITGLHSHAPKWPKTTITSKIATAKAHAIVTAELVWKPHRHIIVTSEKSVRHFCL